MSLLPFLAIAFAAGSAALLTRQRADISGVAGIGGLALAAIAAAVAPVLERLGLAAPPGATAGAEVVLALGALAGLLVVLAGAGVGTIPRSLPGATLLTLAWVGLALLVGVPSAVLLLATAAGATALIPLLDPGAVTERGTVAAAIALRVVVAAGIAALAVATVVDAAVTDAGIRGVAVLALGATVAARLGVIPFHRPAARLAGLAPLPALPLAAIWAPVAFAWVAATIVPPEPPAPERVLVLVVALAGAVLAAVAALIHDDVEHVLGYGLALDGAVALLAFAAPQPAEADLRAWLLVVAASRTALAGWAIAAGGAAGVRRIGELRGWLRRSPLLGLALVGTAAASVGWPGSATWESRAGLFETALGSPFAAAGVLVAIASGVALLRLVVVGIGRAEPGVAREPGGWRIRLRLATASALALAGVAVVVAGGWIGPA